MTRCNKVHFLNQIGNGHCEGRCDLGIKLDVPVHRRGVHVPCRGCDRIVDLIGSIELAEGAEPKYVILSNLQAGCNASSIESISAIFDPDSNRPPLVSLPSGLALLPNLASLVVRGHNIAPAGAHVLLHLSNLTRLELSGPVNSAVDFSGVKGLTTMPPLLFDFMAKDLEQIYLSGLIFMSGIRTS